jgi:hypothetical protein
MVINKGHKGLKGGVVAGVALAVAFGLIGIQVAIFIYYRKTFCG